MAQAAPTHPHHFTTLASIILKRECMRSVDVAHVIVDIEGDLGLVDHATPIRIDV